jgi:plastocyanin
MVALALLLSLVAPGAADARTLRLEGGRDAIVHRAAEPHRLGLFVPTAGGSFERRVLPPLPEPVAALAVVDADGDGHLDLAIGLEGGEVVVWRGNGGGELLPMELEIEPGHAHHGQARAIPIPPAALAALEAPEASGRGGLVRGRFAASGIEGRAWVERGRLLLLDADGSATEALVSPRTVFNVFVGQGGSVFNPSTVNLAVGDSVHWVWSSIGHNVVSGTNCTNNNLFCSPSNTNCGANPTSSTGATYDRTFTSAGSFPYFCRPHCFFGMTGTVHVGAAPGGILEATDLRIARSGADTQFTYTPACGATSHAIYFGSGPINGISWEDSVCVDASGSHTVSLAAPSGLQYFIVVGQNTSAEGSYGKDSTGAERREAEGIGVCDIPQVLSATCP